MRSIIIPLCILFSLLVLGLLLVPSLGIGRVYQLPSEMLPSDYIQKHPHPEIINLQDVSPSSAQAMSKITGPLAAWKPMTMPNYGHYRSDINLTTPEGIPLSLLNFSNTTQTLLKSIINEGTGGKVTEINGSSGTGLVYL